MFLWFNARISSISLIRDSFIQIYMRLHVNGCHSYLAEFLRVSSFLQKGFHSELLVILKSFGEVDLGEARYTLSGDEQLHSLLRVCYAGEVALADLFVCFVEFMKASLVDFITENIPPLDELAFIIRRYLGLAVDVTLVKANTFNGTTDGHWSRRVNNVLLLESNHLEVQVEVNSHVTLCSLTVLFLWRRVKPDEKKKADWRSISHHSRR